MPVTTDPGATTPITTDTPTGITVVRVFPASRAGATATLTAYNPIRGAVNLSHHDGTRSGEPATNWEVLL